jgi:hypothetical protein
MKSSKSARSAFVLPHSQPDSPPPSQEGFTGVNAERSAHAEMTQRAFSIWECKGRLDNTQMADWLEAEAEVLGEK